MSTPALAVPGTEVPRLLFVTGEGESTQILELLRRAELAVSAERVSTPEELKAALEKPWDLTLCGELPGLGFRAVAPLVREKAP
ncbi:MAG TPA: hypothetical protein VGB96_12610, partial [Archangium sp.]